MFQNYDAIPSENNINLDNFTSHQHIDAKSADILLANVAQRQQNGGDASQYKINYDPNPTIIHRENTEDITYKQEVAVRYLQPPTPPIPGPIIIKEIRPPQPPAAPPVIIRQRPPPPQTPPPIIVREAPPPIPETPGPKIITKSLPAPPPPPRRVVIERLPALPPKPRSVIIERWLPYKMPKRRVIYQKADLSKATLNDKVRNLIIQWQGPKSHVVKEVKNLGVVKVNPQQYLQKYANEVKTFQNMQNTLKQYELDLNNDKLAPDSISTFEQQQQEQQQQQSILSNHQQEFNSIFSLNQDEFEEMKQNEEIHESLDPMFNHINTNEINTIINEPIASINFTDESPSTTDDMNLQLTDPNLFNDDKDLLLSNKIIDQSDQQDYGKERDQWI
ncbi:hypothetical protein SNEBB_008805 [Seison nebaliae]|nr:hypothetical protein SNEBB_008805 [Seison nebaliae]